MAGALLSAGLSVAEVFLWTGCQCGGGGLHLPGGARYLLRFIAWVATHVIYRFRVSGEQHIPVSGAVLVCNHVSYVDAVLLMAASPGPSVL